MSKKSQQQLRLVVTSTSRVHIEPVEDDPGWGENGQYVGIIGEIADLRIDIDGVSQFGIRILSGGELILTDYAGMCFQTTVANNTQFSPHGNRGWRLPPQSSNIPKPSVT